MLGTAYVQKTAMERWYQYQGNVKLGVPTAQAVGLHLNTGPAVVGSIAVDDGLALLVFLAHSAFATS